MTYTNILYMKGMSYYWRFSFSGLELYGSYNGRVIGPKHTSMSLSNTPFCANFKYNLKTTVYRQLCYAPNNFSTINDALFYVTSGKAVATYIQATAPYKHCCLVICAQLRLTTKLWAPTTLVHTKLPLYYKNTSLYVYSKVQLTFSCPNEFSTIAASLQRTTVLPDRILHAS